MLTLRKERSPLRGGPRHGSSFDPVHNVSGDIVPTMIRKVSSSVAVCLGLTNYDASLLLEINRLAGESWGEHG